MALKCSLESRGPGFTFLLRNSCCCWSQFPPARSPAVTPARVATAIFFSSLSYSLTLQRKRCCSAPPWSLTSSRSFFAPSFFNIEFISTFCLRKNGATCNPHELKLKGFQRTEEAKAAPTASSSKIVYFLSAMSNAVYRYQGEKMPNLNKQSSNCPLSVFNYSNASGSGHY